MIVIDLSSTVNTFSVKLNQNYTNSFRFELYGLANNINYRYDIGSPTFSNNRFEMFELRLDDEIDGKEIVATGQYKFTISEYHNDSWKVAKFGQATIIDSSPDDDFRQVEAEDDEDDVRSADDIIYG